jgi:prolyl-tRNA synthetase
MRQSQLFSKTTKQLPEGEEAKNAQLLIKGGFVNKSSAGVYSMLPLGLRVLNKINQVIREEMNAIGGEELLMPSLVNKKYWEQSHRWEVDVIYKTSEKRKVESEKDFDYGLGWTHEEVISSIAKHFINSYKDLPKAVYQIQTKFRAEPRAQAGLLRGREFLMKDLYSFHHDEKELNAFYQTTIGAYKKIFDRLCLKARVTEASGGAFTTEYTHEFQVLNPAGEDTILYCEKCDWAQNKEITKLEHGDTCPKCGVPIKMGRGIEVGNVFRLGTKFSKDFNLQYAGANGEKKLVVMGSYGIGPTRLMGTLVEEYHDEKGIVWPEIAAPFRAHVLALGDSEKVKKEAEKLYKNLSGLVGESEVLYDDRSASAGEKLNDADLLGCPVRIVVSEKTMAAKKVEVKKRSESAAILMTAAQLKKLFA